MRSNEWHNRVPRKLGIPVAAALGALGAAALTHGPQAVSQTPSPPVTPPAQALSMQNAFEAVADKLRPSIVLIKSRQTINTPSMVRPGADDGDDSPFNFDFRGFPGMGGQGRGGQQFRMMPQQRPYRAEASGSGVIVRSDGYIMTNDHVVAGADRVTVRLQDGRELVGKVFRDKNSDLALVKIDASGLPAAQLADSDGVKVGQWAIAFGSPFRLQDTMTVGVVSSTKRESSIGSGDDARLYPSLIQTDASINPGNSGGALVDIYGRVIGINVAIESPSGGNVGIGFAIPANTARYIMEQLISKGSVTRGYLGVAPETLDYAAQQTYGVKEGALVRVVSDDTPASRAGIQVGDVIVRFDGKPVTSDADLRDLASRTKPGTTVPVVVHRSGGDTTLNVTIGTLPTTVARADNSGSPASPAAPAQQGKLGVSVANANDANVREQLGLKGSATNGAVIVEVTPGSPAQQAGLQAGDVITRLNGRPIANADALSETARNLKDGATVSAVVRRGTATVLAQINLDDN